MILFIPFYLLLVYNNDCDKHDLGMLKKVIYYWYDCYT